MTAEQTQKQEQTREFFVDAIAGWVAGASSTVCVQPVDTILTRVQSASIPSSFAAAAANTTTTSTSSSLSSRGGSAVGTGTTRNVLQSVFRDGGYKAFFRGLPAATMVIPLQNMLLFVGYGVGERWSKTSMDKNNENKSENNKMNRTHDGLMPVFVGGVCGGIVQSFVVAPFELLKVNQQVRGGSAKAVAERLLTGDSTTRNHADSVAFRGLGSTLLRDGVPHGVWFASYEYFKRKCLERHRGEDQRHLTREEGEEEEGGEEKKLSSIEAMSCGASAGAVAWAVGYPFDTIKTHIQANSSSAYKPNIWEAFSHLRRTNTLYKGFGLKLLRAVPASAICFVSYEECRKLMD